jgi:uncharacterized RDD family membrane protein YckC
MARRVLAALLDAVIVGYTFIFSVQRWGKTLSDGSLGFEGMEGFLVILLMAMYWVGLEWALGGTLGKLLTGLRVISIVKGAEPTFGQSVKRAVLIPVDYFFLYLVAFLVAKFNPNRQRLGDLWAGTMVVTASTARLVEERRTIHI